MSFIMGSCKILQRRTYDLLSHKYSFVFVLLGFLTLTVSVIQFGEVWIERNQSDNSFNSFSDNVIGKPLQKKLCQILPIDVVYTWVNGSDPLLLQQMMDYKKTMLKTTIKCHLPHCLPSHMAAFRGSMKNTEYKYNHKNIQIKQPGKQKGLQNWTIIEFPSARDAMQAVFSSIDVGNDSTLSHAFWTSDKSVPYSYPYPNTVMVTGLSPDVLSKLSEMTPSQFSVIANLNIKEIWIDEEEQAIILEFQNDPSSKEIHKLNNFAFFGHFVNATKAHLVLELPPPWDSEDLAPSRFEDKEELRYSLRSLETYAPWVRHVYLVTNGQIPYWLNLDNPKLTLLTHEDIFPNSSHLPTFSSPAIESHIHRIPGLSQYFLYMNDDVFFGQEVWPEDFITYAKGQKVYLSWPVPDCSESCPWSWIGDGSCDIACNISDCAFDGGDCHPSNENMFPNEDFYDEHHSDHLDSPLHDHLFDDGPLDLHDLHIMENSRKIPTGIDTSLQVQYNRTFSKQSNTSGTNIHTSTHANQNISLLYGNVTPIHKAKIMKQERRKIKMSEMDKTTHNKLFTLLKNLESKENVETQRKWNFNRQLKLFNNPNNTFSLTNPIQGTAQNKLQDNSSKQQQKSVSFQNNYNLKGVTAWVHKKSKDTFAESLLFVNRLFNNEFGFEVRKVPAHMPHLIDKRVMNILQNRFPEEWDRTSSHKIRNVRDMQYAFSYFYFLMSEKENRTIAEIFEDFDTDRSGTWSDREIRTVLTQLFDLPLSYYKVVHFEEQICNCSLHAESDQTISTPLYERYQDSKLPVVSKTLISKCEPIKHALLEKFGSRKKYQTEVVKDKSQAVTFKMLSSNLSQLIVILDEVRRDPKKFICLNDNLDPTLEKDNAIVRAVLQDFYESLFPMPSNFELPLEYRNRFLHMSELRAWRAGRTILRNGIYACIFLLMIFTALSFFRIECCSQQKRRSRRTYQEV